MFLTQDGKFITLYEEIQYKMPITEYNIVPTMLQ